MPLVPVMHAYATNHNIDFPTGRLLCSKKERIGEVVCTFVYSSNEKNPYVLDVRA